MRSVYYREAERELRKAVWTMVTAASDERDLDLTWEDRTRVADWVLDAALEQLEVELDPTVDVGRYPVKETTKS